MSENQNSNHVAGFAVTIPGTLAPYQLIIPGRLPGLNEYTDACRSNSQKGGRIKSEAQMAIMWQIKAQLRRLHIEKPVFLLFTFYEQDRRRDRDNVSSFARKVIQDALVKTGTLTDDGWDYVTGYLDRFAVDKDNPALWCSLSSRRCRRHASDDKARAPRSKGHRAQGADQPPGGPRK